MNLCERIGFDEKDNINWVNNGTVKFPKEVLDYVRNSRSISLEVLESIHNTRLKLDKIYRIKHDSKLNFIKSKIREDKIKALQEMVMLTYKKAIERGLDVGSPEVFAKEWVEQFNV